ncbi:MAG: hypothetical protein ACREAA_04700 [Candidatus Polarisedimenticolia bacterium]
MMRLLAGLMVVLSMGCGAAFPQEPPPPGQVGPLRLDITVDDHPGSVSSQPGATGRFRAGQTIYVAFLVSNQATGPNGRVHVQIDCRIFGPDGKARFERTGAAEARGPCQGHNFCMADPAVAFASEPGDPPGTYRIEGMARDMVSGQRASTRASFHLSAPAEGEIEPLSTCFPGDEALERWMMSYYLTPVPGKLSCALAYYAGTAEAKANSPLPFAHFYAALIGDDADALGRLFDQLGPQGDPMARVVTLHVFRLSGSPRGPELLGRGCKEWSTLEVDRLCAAMSRDPRTPLLEEPLQTPDVLDSLWARFAATGDPAFVRRIASIAHMKEDGHGLDIVMGGAACWSLTSMAGRHPRVRETLEEMAGQAQGTQKAALEKILQDSRRPPE